MADLERKILSKLTRPAEIGRVWELGLRAEVFVEPIHRAVYEWMVDYWLDSHMQAAPTWVVMQHEFPSIPLDEHVEESTGWLVDNLKRRFAANRAQTLMLAAATTTGDDPIGSMDTLWREAYDICQTVAPRFSRADMSQTVAERRRRYARRHDQVDVGMTLGLPELDRHTRGLLPGELCAVVAYTKTGKSFFLALAAIAARRAGYTPLLMTLEQGVDEMQERIDALHSGVSYTRIQDGSLSFEESRTLAAAQDELTSMGRLLVEKPQRGERTVRHMTSRCRQAGADYLIVDQLSFIDAERTYTGDRAITAKHGDLIFDLKDDINRESAGKLPCMLAVQMNREGVRDRASGGRGGLSNIAHSSMIEQTVDIALGLWRNNELRNNNAMGLDIMGSRRSDLRSWLLHWELHERSRLSIREDYEL